MIPGSGLQLSEELLFENFVDDAPLLGEEGIDGFCVTVAKNDPEPANSKSVVADQCLFKGLDVTPLMLQLLKSLLQCSPSFWSEAFEKGAQ